jgi:hypothetical protein
MLITQLQNLHTIHYLLYSLFRALLALLIFSLLLLVIRMTVVHEIQLSIYLYLTLLLHTLLLLS